MPKKEIDYSKTVMYKIVCNDLETVDCYVGHTTDFTKRKTKHKYSCNHEAHKTFNYDVYKMIRSKGGWSNWSMIEIEKYPCSDGNEARKRERHWYEALKPSLNIVVPTRTRKEYYNQHREEMLKAQKANYLEKREEKLEKCKIYREKNNERRRAYRELHRDEFNRKQREKRALLKAQSAQQST